VGAGREEVTAEPAVAADGAGIAAFRAITQFQPALLLNLVVRHKETPDMLRLNGMVIPLLLAVTLLGGCAKSAAPGAGNAVTGEEFDRLLKSLKAETFDDGKVSFIKSISSTRAFTCEQLRQLLTEFSFDQGREEASVTLYPRVTDPENFFMVLGVFTFDEGRDSVRQRLKLH
jgi:hypothetical protein